MFNRPLFPPITVVRNSKLLLPWEEIVSGVPGVTVAGPKNNVLFVGSTPRFAHVHHCYVMDRWEWSRFALATNAAYAAETPSAPGKWRETTYASVAELPLERRSKQKTADRTRGRVHPFGFVVHHPITDPDAHNPIRDRLLARPVNLRRPLSA
jgi:hypothetical protein